MRFRYSWARRVAEALWGHGLRPPLSLAGSPRGNPGLRSSLGLSGPSLGLPGPKGLGELGQAGAGGLSRAGTRG